MFPLFLIPTNGCFDAEADDKILMLVLHAPTYSDADAEVLVDSNLNGYV